MNEIFWAQHTREGLYITKMMGVKPVWPPKELSLAAEREAVF
jgi:hypothetical protein